MPGLWGKIGEEKGGIGADAIFSNGPKDFFSEVGKSGVAFYALRSLLFL